MTIAYIKEYAIANGFDFQDTDISLRVEKNDNWIEIDKSELLFYSSVLIKHKRIANLHSEENYCVIILLLLLWAKGYSSNSIILEKDFQVGHNSSGYLDVFLESPDKKIVYMFDAKRYADFNGATDINKKKYKQIFSYAFQEKRTKIISYFSYDFENKKPFFKNVFTAELLTKANNLEDCIDRWNKVYDESNFIINNPLFNVKPTIIRFNSLKDITEESTNILFKGFLDILRIHAISDKPNAFNKIINLLLCKIVDEFKENMDFTVSDKGKVSGMQFQFIDGEDDETFLKRLNNLYKEGAKQYLNKNIIDYSDEEIDSILEGLSNPKIKEVINNLRLKKSNEFAFIEVYDNESFHNNCIVVKEIVKLFQSYKFRYTYKHQYLGNFFEELLNTSLKQDEGQFFTPYPLVNFIISSLNLEEKINKNLQARDKEFIPKVIDYACGSGHFLISYMNYVQSIIDDGLKDRNKLNTKQEQLIQQYIDSKYNWVTVKNVVGIEKDYRLSKTTKIATFLNGDGEAGIITTDALNKFQCNEFKKNDIQENTFDFLLSNPPYSIKGFKNLFINSDINEKDFVLLNKDDYTLQSTEIEIFFIERAWHLLKEGGIGVLLLPQSILTANKKYVEIRKFLLSRFKLKIMVMLSDISFLGTTTSPIIFFLEKKKMDNKYDYEIMSIFSAKYLLEYNFNKSEEENFLGYKFSSNKNVATTKTQENSILKQLTPYCCSFLSNNSLPLIKDSVKKHLKIGKLSDIILGDTLQIFPKYKKMKGVSIGNIFTINPSYTINSNLPYVEISNIKNGQIKPSEKNKEGRICEKGDILIPSLVPSKEKIALSNERYNVSNAIHVLSIKEQYKDKKDVIFEEIKKDYVITQMRNLTEGFKITYSKIGENNLSKYVKLNMLF